MSNHEFDGQQYVYIDKNQTQMGKLISKEANKVEVQLLTPIIKFQVNKHVPFYRELILSNSTRKVNYKDDFQKLNVFKLSDYLNNFYNFEKQTLDQKSIEAENAYVLRFFLKGKKQLISIDSGSNICFYCQETQKEGDIYKCGCGKLYHLSCYEKNKKCFECDENLFLDLKKNRNKEEFDFSNINYKSFKQNNNVRQKPVRLESSQEVLKQRNSINYENSELQTYLEQFKKKYKQKNVNLVLEIRNKIRNQFFKIFLKAVYQNIGNKNKIGKLSKMNLQELADYIERLSLNIDKTLYNKFDQRVTKKSLYSQHSKLLIHSLKNHNQQIVQNVLTQKMTLNDLCSLTQQELMDQNLQEKIERNKKEFWEARKIEDEDIAKPINFKESGDKNANREIVPVGLEPETKDSKIQVEQKQGLYKSQQSLENIDQNKSLNDEKKVQDLKEFQENLYLKMKEYLDKDQYETIKTKLDEVYKKCL